MTFIMLIWGNLKELNMQYYCAVVTPVLEMIITRHLSSFICLVSWGNQQAALALLRILECSYNFCRYNRAVAQGLTISYLAYYF